MWFVDFIVKTFFIIILLFISPIGVVYFMTSLVDIFNAVPNSMFEIIKLLFLYNGVEANEIGLYLSGIFIGFMLFLVICFFRVSFFGELNFDFFIFILSILIIPMIIDICFYYLKINLDIADYSKFFHEFFYQVIKSNFFYELLKTTTEEEALLLIELYSRAIATLIQIKAWIYSILVDLYIHFFLIIYFLYCLIKQPLIVYVKKVNR